MDLFTHFLESIGRRGYGVAVPLLFGSALVAFFLARWMALRLLRRMPGVFTAGQAAIGHPVIALATRLAYIVPAAILMSGLPLVQGLSEGVRRIMANVCGAFIVVVAALAASKVVDLADRIYSRRVDARDRPIKGYLQLLKILIGILAVVLAIAALTDRNPLLLLSGLGAMAAVLMLVFQDTLLSIVAGMQIGSNDMVRIGDWIEMPSLNADGDVIEIALHTVKVRNWDKTITTLPIRSLITTSFKNWRGMHESGGRRIKRSLFIDQRSIRFLEPDEIAHLEAFVLLDDYLHRKRSELAEWNVRLEDKGANPVNSRRITNIGTFRAYVTQYLKSLATVNQDMIMIVRQLQPGPTGLPLEVYCFTSNTRWAVYENIQSDIFDHLLAILPSFDLRVFQQCSDLSGMPIAQKSIQI